MRKDRNDTCLLEQGTLQALLLAGLVLLGESALAKAHFGAF